MLKQKRQMQILELLHRDGEATVSALSRSFGVAEMTIRRDLESLCARGCVVRTHGGALPGSLPANDIRPDRETENTILAGKEGKYAVAKKALSCIRDGTTVYFDADETVMMLANCVPASQHIGALTHSVPIARELMERQFVTVILIGGELKKSGLSCRGPAAEDMLERFRFDLAFVGVNAVGRDGGLYTVSMADAGLKRRIIAAADRCIVLADSSKLFKQSFCRFADLSETGMLMTDDGIAADQLAVLSALDIQVSVAKTNRQRPVLHG